MIIMKFGGSSLRDATRIKEVINLIKLYLEKHPLVVCSAMGKTTDALIKAGRSAAQGDINFTNIKEQHLQIIKELELEETLLDGLFLELQNVLNSIAILHEVPNKISDLLVSFGERMSVRVMAATLSKYINPAKPFDAYDLGFVTNSRFGNAEVLEESFANLKKSCAPFFEKYEFTPVVTGFIAKDSSGNVTTLGRSGSDLTASVIGAALNAEEVQVWKDVDGLLSTDPRIVKCAHPVGNVSFEEASELAFYGAKVLHPLSIKPAMSHNIPVRVKNSYNPDHPGTLITAEKSPSSNPVKVITCKRDVTLIDIVSSNMLWQYGFLAQVFKVFSDNRISIDMLASSEVSISLTLDKNEDLVSVINELQTFASVQVHRNKAIISLICDIKHTSEILDKAFHALNDININVQMISQGASKVNIGFVVDDDQAEQCIIELHKAFFEQQHAKNPMKIFSKSFWKRESK